MNITDSMILQLIQIIIKVLKLFPATILKIGAHYTKLIKYKVLSLSIIV